MIHEVASARAKSRQPVSCLKLRRFARATLVAGLIVIGTAVPCEAAFAAPYSNGFESDIAGWCDLTASGFFPCDGVDRGTISRTFSTSGNPYTNGGYADGVPSETGDYHARFGRPSGCFRTV